MKSIALIIFILIGVTVKGQFPSTDSLRNFNNRFITNDAKSAFTNLRLHNLLDGIIDFIDTVGSGGGTGLIGMDTLYRLNDTTLRYRKNGTFFSFTYKGKNWNLQEILNNGSALTENETITLLDSLVITSGKAILDSLRLRVVQSIDADTSNFKVAVFDASGNLKKSINWNNFIASVKWYNIADAGADRTGATDISTYITAAMAAGRRDIYLPKGRYLISNTVQMKDSVTIRGDGKQNTIIVLTSSIPAFKLSNSLGGYSCQFMDFGFLGNSGPGGDGLQTGISADSINRLYIHNVGGYKLGGWLIRLRSNGNITKLWGGSIISDCHADSCYGGFKLDTSAEYNTIENSTANYCLYGCFVAGGNNRINSNSFTVNQYNLYLTGGSNNGHGVATGNTFNHATNTNVYITDVNLGFTFIGNMIYAGNAQLTIINSDNVQFTGGDIVGTGAATITNSTNIHFTDVNMRQSPTWLITGNPPSIFKNGAVDNSISIIDVVNNKQLDITHVNGTTNFTLPAGSRYTFSDTVGIKTSSPSAVLHVTGLTRVDGQEVVTANTNYRSLFVSNLPAQLIMNQGAGNWGFNLQRSGGTPHLTWFMNGGASMSTLSPTIPNVGLGDGQFMGVDSGNVIRTPVQFRADVERCAANFLSAGFGIFTTDSSGTQHLFYINGRGNVGLGDNNDFSRSYSNPFRLNVSDGMVRFGFLKGSGNIIGGVDNNGIFHKTIAGDGIELNTNGDTLKVTKSINKTVLIDSFSNAANVDINLSALQNVGYARIEIQIECRPVTDNVTLMMRLSNDGGATFSAGATDYGWVNKWSIFVGPADGVNADDQDSELELVQNIGNAAGNTCNGRFTLYHPFDGSLIPIYEGAFTTNSNTTSPSGAMILSQVGGQMFTARYTNAIRFLLSSGNFDKFKYTVIGYKN